MPTSKNNVSSVKELPKHIRDELRMTAAMRCYSVLRSGSTKSLNAQYERMSSLFHGEEPAVPSNIDMLCRGVYNYKELYDLVDCETVTSKTDNGHDTVEPSLVLKKTLSRDDYRSYYAGRDIIQIDLEKKGRNGKQLITGRNLLDMGKRGMATYKKALSYAVKKYDIENMKVLESGLSVDDVVEYVRTEMYQIHLKDEAIKKNNCFR